MAGLLAVMGGGLAGCGALSISERCGRSYSRGSSGYRECVRREQAEVERIRERSDRLFPRPNLP